MSKLSDDLSRAYLALENLQALTAAARTQHDLTYRDIAAAAGVSVPTARLVILGKTEPSMQSARRLIAWLIDLTSPDTDTVTLHDHPTAPICCCHADPCPACPLHRRI